MKPAFLIAVLALFSRGTCNGQPRLLNEYLSVKFGPAGMVRIAQRETGGALNFAADGFEIEISGRKHGSSAMRVQRGAADSGHVEFLYSDRDVEVRCTYELKESWSFVSKRLTVKSLLPGPYRVGQVSPLLLTMSRNPLSTYTPRPHYPQFATKESRQIDGVENEADRDEALFLRFPKMFGAFLSVQNPFLRVSRSGAKAAIAYSADLTWDPSQGPFLADTAVVGLYRLTGKILPQHMTEDWRPVLGPIVPGMDRAEVDALTACVRAFLLQAGKPLRVQVGWALNDYQIDVASASGRAQYQRVFAMASDLGISTQLFAPANSDLSRRADDIDTARWEHVTWLGLGQKIRLGQWRPGADEVPVSVRRMLNDAGEKGVSLLAYVFPTLSLTGGPAQTSLAARADQDALLDLLVRFQAATGIAGYSFDFAYLRLAGPSRYAQWAGMRRVLEELRRRLPNIVIDGRQWYHLYGPWTWLAGSYPHPLGTDEQPESFRPFPDLHFDRVSGDRQRQIAYWYRNYQFCPTEILPGFITHQTPRKKDSETLEKGELILDSFRLRDWDVLGWRYSLLSSIATAGWNHVINLVPGRDAAEFASFSQADKLWFRSWLDWAQEHKDLLLHTRSIFGQPAIGQVDGTSAIDRDHGFLFLFNPNYKQLQANFTIAAELGIDKPGPYVLRELYPRTGVLLGKSGAGFWSLGDRVRIEMQGTSAAVFELTPARFKGPLLFNSPGTAVVNRDTLTIEGVSGEFGTSAELFVSLPDNTVVRTVTINGLQRAFHRVGKLVSVKGSFSGRRFSHSQRIELTPMPDLQFRGTLEIPERIFAQLRKRHEDWPMKWTAEELTRTWLAPERLLAYFPASTESAGPTLEFDGVAIPMLRAYTAARSVPSTFTGWYADLSHLLPDHEYQVKLTLAPGVSPRSFEGLFLDNIEPQYTRLLAQ